MPFLPDPKVIEDYSLKEIIESIKESFLKKYPDTLFDETSPLYEMASQFAYREILLRERINRLAQKLLIMLDEAYSEKRLVSGTFGYYRNKVLEVPYVLDLEICAHDNGEIFVYVLLSPSGKTEIEDVKSHLELPQNHLLNDKITIKTASIIPFELIAHFILEKGIQIDLETAKKVISQKINSMLKIGNGLSLSAINAILFKDGVLDVQIKSPKESFPSKEGHILKLEKIELSYEFN